MWQLEWLDLLKKIKLFLIHKPDIVHSYTPKAAHFKNEPVSLGGKNVFTLIATSVELGGAQAKLAKLIALTTGTS
mgnify:CR=1 FL=1